MSATYTAEQVADLAGCSTWSVYNSVKDGSCPFPFVKVGRRILFVRSAVDRLLGIEGGE